MFLQVQGSIGEREKLSATVPAHLDPGKKEFSSDVNQTVLKKDAKSKNQEEGGEVR